MGRDHAQKKYPGITFSLDCLARLAGHALQRIKGQQHPECVTVIREVVRELRFEEQAAARSALGKMLSERSKAHRKAHRHETAEMF
ncbi:MAG: hypothetical protein AAB442_02230 [Patescibacteria group bacterium]